MFRDLTAQKECTIEEGHLMSDHVHILVSIPPKYSVAQIVGLLKLVSYLNRIDNEPQTLVELDTLAISMGLAT